jgi:hypothetical protein
MVTPDAVELVSMATADVTVPEPPPLPLENPGNRPSATALWYHGFWRWDPVLSSYIWQAGFWQEPKAAPTMAPPPPHPEIPSTHAPGPGYTWTAGFWRWSGGQYQWVPGHWVYTNNAAAQVSPHWEQVNGRWVWCDDDYAHREEGWRKWNERRDEIHERRERAERERLEHERVARERAERERIERERIERERIAREERERNRHGRAEIPRTHDDQRRPVIHLGR